MDNAIAIKDDVKLTVADIKKYIAPNATDKELFMFMGVSKSFGLNPFKREVHFIKYGNAAASIVVGYEQYLKRAERTGKLDGWKCWTEKDELGEKAIIEIKRKDQSLPIRWEVYRKEFDKGQSTWKTMGIFMLKKVAISQGFRLAFPDDLGGMPYIPEELPQTNEKIASEQLNKDIITVEEVKDDIPEALGTEPSYIDESQKLTLQTLIVQKNVEEKRFLDYMGVDSLDHIISDEYEKAHKALKNAKGNAAA